jgi:hypothetical protein
MRKPGIFLLMVLLAAGLYAADGKFDTIMIKTSSQCDECKETIEEALAFEKGVKTSDLDVETRILTVTYKKSKQFQKLVTMPMMLLPIQRHILSWMPVVKNRMTRMLLHISTIKNRQPEGRRTGLKFCTIY